MSRKANDDFPRCDHKPGFKHLVSNQSDEYDKDRGLCMAWVCEERACVLDAMAWVERHTGEKATVRPPHPEIA